MITSRVGCIVLKKKKDNNIPTGLSDVTIEQECLNIVRSSFFFVVVYSS